MKKSDINLASLPDEPGVYIFYKGSTPLYVGKATNLRSRVRSYFDPLLPVKRSQKVAAAVRDATRIETRVTDSVLEALLLESRLIKMWMPAGNTDAKDDKSYWYVIITKERVPRVLSVRGRVLPLTVPQRLVAKRYGPFVHGKALKEALAIIRNIFSFYDTPFPITDALSPHAARKVAFNQSIGVYPSDTRVYKRDLRHITMLFDGKKQAIVTELEAEMARASKELRFEDAATCKRKLFALKHIRETALIGAEYREPDVAQFRIEGYDTSHLRGGHARAAMVVVDAGEPVKAEYRLFTIDDANGDDIRALKEALTRRLTHSEWPLPQLIVIDGGEVHLSAAKEVVHAEHPTIELVAVVKDERHKPREILGRREIIEVHKAGILLANTEAHRFSLSRHRRARNKAAIL